MRVLIELVGPAALVTLAIALSAYTFANLAY